MSWTTPRTWVAGEIVTAPQLNVHLRDNLAFAHGLAAPKCRLYLDADQETATSNDESIVWTDSQWETQGMWTGQGSRAIRIPTGADGIYMMAGQVTWEANNTGTRWAYFEHNGYDGSVGETTPDHYGVSYDAGANRPRMHLYDEWALVAPDYICLTGWQNSGGNLDMDNGFLMLRWLNP